MDIFWNTAPAPVLGTGDVHLWRAWLMAAPEIYQQMEKTLSPAELARAERFRFEQDRRRNVVAHGYLRSILGAYFHQEPAALKLGKEAGGKPVIFENGSLPLYYNLSHSGELALYAITLQRRIGVDLEMIAPLPQAGDIAKRIFSQRENTYLAEVEGSGDEGFYRAWTLKEAYLKALGKGLSIEPGQIDLSELMRIPLNTWTAWEEPEQRTKFSFCIFQPAAGYTAALAVEGPVEQATFFRANPAV